MGAIVARTVRKLHGKRALQGKNVRVIRVSTGTFRRMAAAPKAAAAPGLRAAVLASRERAAG